MTTAVKTRHAEKRAAEASADDVTARLVREQNELTTAQERLDRRLAEGDELSFDDEKVRRMNRSEDEATAGLRKMQMVVHWEGIAGRREDYEASKDRLANATQERDEKLADAQAALAKAQAEVSRLTQGPVDAQRDVERIEGARAKLRSPDLARGSDYREYVQRSRNLASEYYELTCAVARIKAIDEMPTFEQAKATGNMDGIRGYCFPILQRETPPPPPGKSVTVQMNDGRMSALWAAHLVDLADEKARLVEYVAYRQPLRDADEAEVAKLLDYWVDRL